MDSNLSDLVARLADEFEDLQDTTIVRVITDCADEFPGQDVGLVEQAARARLSAARAGRVSDFESDEAPQSDSRGELGLVGRLIVAVNDSDGPLSQEQIDRILGVRPHAV